MPMIGSAVVSSFRKSGVGCLIVVANSSSALYPSQSFNKNKTQYVLATTRSCVYLGYLAIKIKVIPFRKHADYFNTAKIQSSKSKPYGNQVDRISSVCKQGEGSHRSCQNKAYMAFMSYLCKGVHPFSRSRLLTFTKGHSIKSLAISNRFHVMA